MRAVAARWMMLMGFAAIVAGCVTTEQAGQAMQSRWIGQDADVFFQRYGAPISEFALSSGDLMYTWRGGETTKYIAATYSNPPAAANPSFGTSPFGRSSSATDPLYSRERVRTETQVENPRAGMTRTTTTTTSSSASIGLGGFGSTAGGRQMLSPPRTEQLFCELQITVDRGNMIRSLRITRDTAAAGIGLSRCAEVLDVRN